MMGKHSLLGKGFSLLVASVFLFTNGLLAHSAEKKFWTERRQAIEKTRHSSSGLQVAGLPANLFRADPFEILKQVTVLPKEVSPSLSGTLAESLPTDFMASHKVLFESLPLSLGAVRSVALPKGLPKYTVIHIQDVHLNQEAQENIAGVVRSLSEKKVASVLALEGAWGPMDFSDFRSFHDHGAVRLAADYLLRNNQITGPVHASFTGPIDFPVVVGVDDEKQYHANVNAYKQSSSIRKDTKDTLTQARRRLNAQKPNVFNQALLEFDRNVENYREGEGKLGVYVKAISMALPNKKSFPAVAGFLGALQMEEVLNFKQVELERTELIHALAKALKPFQVNTLLDKSLAYRSGQLRYSEFYPYLRNLCEESGVSLKKFPAMDDYVRYVLASDHINADGLFKELNRMENIVYDKLSKTLEEKTLVSESHRLLLTSKLVDFSLTTEEWKEYETFPKKASTNSLDLTSFESFYKNAIARDESMARNFLQQMGMAGRGSKSASRVGILVTGGFHSEGITNQLKNSGAAVVRFVPRIANGRTNGSEYLSVFTQEKAPLEKLFSGETLFLGINQVEPESHIQRQLATIVALLRLNNPDADTISNKVKIIEWDKNQDRVKALVAGVSYWVRLTRDETGRISGVLVSPASRARAIDLLASQGKEISEWAIAKTVIFRGWEAKDFLFHPIRFFRMHENRSVGESVFRGVAIGFGFALSWGVSVYPALTLVEFYVFPMTSFAWVAASVIVGGGIILSIAVSVNQLSHLILDWLIIHFPPFYRTQLERFGFDPIEKETERLNRVVAEKKYISEFFDRLATIHLNEDDVFSGFKAFAHGVVQISRSRHFPNGSGSLSQPPHPSQVLWDILNYKLTESEQNLVSESFRTSNSIEFDVPSQRIMAELLLSRLAPPVLVANGASPRFIMSIGNDEPLDPKQDGEKAYRLGVFSQLGIQTPPGFALLPSFYTSEYKRKKNLSKVWGNVLDSVRQLEARTGQSLGDEGNPLLLSVRSNAGEEESMPGLMKTIVNVGLNQKTMGGLEQRGGKKFALDTLRRFIRSYATAVFDIPDEQFYVASTPLLLEFRVSDEAHLPAGGLEKLVEEYRSIVNQSGREIPEDPEGQLKESLEAVLKSFDSEGARIFKEARGLSDTGMGAIVQQMVFGNLNSRSGSGVVFTRNRRTGENKFDGQYGIGIQGEDVVSGRHARELQDVERLATAMPQVFDLLSRTKSLVEKRFAWPQDLEFTIQDGDLFVLQTRDEEMFPEALLQAGLSMVEEGTIGSDVFLRRKAAQMAKMRIVYHVRKGIEETIVLGGGNGTPRRAKREIDVQ